MNTSAGYYQAPRPPRVPLDEVLIKLHPEGFHQQFEADGINVGSGGLSMRASVLPQVGSTLRCQLDNPRGGEAIEMIGRVVWAHESGPHAGEFGIRFTHLSDRDQAHIEALIQSWGRTSAKAPTVRLRLDGVGSHLVAEVRSQQATGLSVEQPLPFLAIGNAVLDETAGRRGHLEAVELKMDDKTPKLVLSIGYQVPDAQDAAADDDDDAERDTLPDEALPLNRIERPGAEARTEDRPRIVRYDRANEAEDVVSMADRLRTHAHSAGGQVAAGLKRVHSTVADELVPRARRQIREFYGLIRRFVDALRTRLDDKPRRKQVPRSQAARAHLKNTRRNRRRYVLVGAMACGIVAAGWLTYLWAASAAETESGSGSTASADSTPKADSAPATESASATVKKTAPAKPTTEAPASKADGYAIQGAPLPPKPVRGTSFGADSVPGGEKHVLRMSNDVTEMEGLIEDDGFSVTIPGSLSLSRAGPIAAAHPDVEHASILNRGDFSELTVRFVAGRRPLYRVEAHGPTIEITLQR
jgi:hypothetical protein